MVSTGRLIDQSWWYEIFYLTMHSTHFIYGYMAWDIMVKGHSTSQRGKPQPQLHGLLFPISSKGSFYTNVLTTELHLTPIPHGGPIELFLVPVSV